MLRRQYYQEIEQGHVTTQSKFNYGECTRWSGYKVCKVCWKCRASVSWLPHTLIFTYTVIHRWTPTRRPLPKKAQNADRAVGWGLIKSPNADLQTEGIKLLQGESS